MKNLRKIGTAQFQDCEHKPKCWTEFESTFKSVDFDYSRKGKEKFCNVSMSFDIETTSTFLNGEKFAFAYEWTFAVQGQIFFGRNLFDFPRFIKNVKSHFEGGIIVIYVHNLSYEFQFIRKLFTWSKVFAMKEREPLYCRTEDDIEFRCSYLLTGKSLQALGEVVGVDKLIGSLDYSKIRHPLTPLTDEELDYCVHDVIIIDEYIQKQIEIEGGISKIPLTKTGYVRRLMRLRTVENSDVKMRKKYRNMIKKLTLTNEDYLQMRRAFQGGFTHAGLKHSGKTLSNVQSFDFTSSYPAVMLSEQFPGEKVFHEDFVEFEELLNVNDYIFVGDFTFFQVRLKDMPDCPVSFSRCFASENVEIDNGRIRTAEKISITLTDVDLRIFSQYYEFKESKCENVNFYSKMFLPKEIVECVIDLYQDKTKLKGVKGQEDDYLLKKEMLNSTYGMMVTDICRDVIDYSDMWDKTLPDIDKVIEQYNTGKRRFLHYPWGVWITAYARKNLFEGITESGNDFVYADTDSVKLINGERHEEFFKDYNEKIVRKIETVLKYYDIPVSQCQPKTVKGEIKPLGVWDFEGEFPLFKTLGAKRYIYLENGEIHATIAGCNKKGAACFLSKGGILKAFEEFKDGVEFPAEFSGRLIHTYIDKEMEGDVIDYLGNKERIISLSSIHLSSSTFTLSLSEEYARLMSEV